jgi:hypothetical protein
VRVLCLDSSTEVHLDLTVEPIHLSYSATYTLILLKGTDTYLLQKTKYICQHKHAGITNKYVLYLSHKLYFYRCSHLYMFWSLNNTHQVAKHENHKKTIKLQKCKMHRHFKGMYCRHLQGKRVNQAGYCFLAWLTFQP